MKAKTPTRPPLIEAGQVWQLDESTCHIREVGRTLVHYKMCKGTQRGKAVTIANKDALAQFLRTRKAVLVGG